MIVAAGRYIQCAVNLLKQKKPRNPVVESHLRERKPHIAQCFHAFIQSERTADDENNMLTSLVLHAFYPLGKGRRAHLLALDAERYPAAFFRQNLDYPLCLVFHRQPA